MCATSLQTCYIYFSDEQWFSTNSYQEDDRQSNWLMMPRRFFARRQMDCYINVLFYLSLTWCYINKILKRYRKNAFCQYNFKFQNERMTRKCHNHRTKTNHSVTRSLTYYAKIKCNILLGTLYDFSSTNHVNCKALSVRVQNKSAWLSIR